MHTQTRRGAGSTRSFTLIELMIGLIVLGILATIALPAYSNFIEDGKTQLCEQNLAAVKSAWDVYIVEHNVVPGDLSMLPQSDIDKVFAQGMRSAGWQAKFALFIEEQQARGSAFASLVDELGKGNLRMLYCPSDSRRNGSNPGTIVSYGINNALQGMTSAQYQAQPNDMLIVADCAGATFKDTIIGSMSQRHKHAIGGGTVIFANAITKGGWVKKAGIASQITSRNTAEKAILNDASPWNSQKKIKIQNLWKNWS